MGKFATAVTNDTGVNETRTILAELKTEIQKQAMGEIQQAAIELAGNIILLDSTGANGAPQSPWLRAENLPYAITSSAWTRSYCYPDGKNESPTVGKALNDRIELVMNEDFLTGINMLAREHLNRTGSLLGRTYDLTAEIFPDQTSQDKTTGIVLHGKSAETYRDQIIKRLTEGSLGWTIQVLPGEGLLYNILDAGSLEEILDRDETTRQAILNQIDERTPAGQASLNRVAEYVAKTTETMLGMKDSPDPARHEYMAGAIKKHLADSAMRNFTLRIS